jgi:hypothetical protein
MNMVNAAPCRAAIGTIGSATSPYLASTGAVTPERTSGAGSRQFAKKKCRRSVPNY